MKYSSDQPIGCCVVLVNKQGQVLAGKRKNAYKAGYYGIPGGILEKNEKIKDCASRELLEETGVTAMNLTYVGVVREFQENYTFVHFVFKCTKWDGTPEVIEKEKCESWRWYDTDALPKMLPGHKAAVELLKDHTNYKDI